MPGRTPAAAGAADAGVGAPHNSMTHARKALSVSRWRDRATGIRALYRIKANGRGASSEDHFAGGRDRLETVLSGLWVEVRCGKTVFGTGFFQAIGGSAVISGAGQSASTPARIGARLASPHRHAIDHGIDRLKIRDAGDA